MEFQNDVSVELGRRAKELAEGMRARIKREPDVADFAAAFAPMLKRFDKQEIDNKSEERCLEKAKMRGDIAFTLVRQDLSSPTVICEWIKQNIETAPPAKLRNALERALSMRSYPRRKHAD
jgi:hypothetical protein